ncbi:MAG: hypothetical protein RBU37_22145 [Myxococcota bacterium]|jgi:hypothetical protein|nr:hypothetical protein [Myxococcota bacterium]
MNRSHLLFLALASSLLACGPKQTNTGIKFVDTDGSQSAANGLFFDMGPVDDRLNTSAGDSQDWRYIIIPTSGRLSVTVNVDDPNMPGAWVLRDPEGRTVHQQSLNPAQGFYEVRSLPVRPGQYYFQISAFESASPYTVGATFEPDPEPVVVAEVEPEPEVEEPKEKVRSSRGSKDKTDKPKKDPKPKTDEPKDDAGAASAGNTKVVGTVTLVTPRDDGTAEITIRGVGGANGVTEGMKGKVEGLSVSVKTTKCYTTKCEAVVSGASARDLREQGKVVFMVP